MVNSGEIENMVQSEQLTNLIEMFIKTGKLDKARELVRKLIAIDNQRIVELSRINVNSSNYEIVMKELRELYWLYKG